MFLALDQANLSGPITAVALLRLENELINNEVLYTQVHEIRTNEREVFTVYMDFVEIAIACHHGRHG
jgi:hypothetical protein